MAGRTGLVKRTFSSTLTKALNIRVSPEEKKVIQRAAQILDKTVSYFVVTTLINAAEEIIKDAKRK